MSDGDPPGRERYVDRATDWLEGHAPRRPPAEDLRWGEGPDDVALFKNLTFEGERDHIDEVRLGFIGDVEFKKLLCDTRIKGEHLLAKRLKKFAHRRREQVWVIINAVTGRGCVCAVGF